MVNIRVFGGRGIFEHYISEKNQPTTLQLTEFDPFNIYFSKLKNPFLKVPTKNTQYFSQGII